MKNSLAKVVTAAVILLGPIACAEQQPPSTEEESDSIVGLWQPTGEPYLIEFFPDGSVQFRDDKASAGNYSFPDDSHVRIDIDGKTMIARYEFVGDRLLFTESGRKDLMLVRTSQEELARLADLHKVRDIIHSSLIVAGAPKAAITEYYQDYQVFPSSLMEAGAPMDPSILPPGIESYSLLSEGVLVIDYTFRYMEDVPESIASLIVYITPEILSNDNLAWNCTTDPELDDMAEAVPASCWP